MQRRQRVICWKTVQPSPPCGRGRPRSQHSGTYAGRVEELDAASPKSYLLENCSTFPTVRARAPAVPTFWNICREGRGIRCSVAKELSVGKLCDLPHRAG